MGPIGPIEESDAWKGRKSYSGGTGGVRGSRAPRESLDVRYAPVPRMRAPSLKSWCRRLVGRVPGFGASGIELSLVDLVVAGGVEGVEFLAAEHEVGDAAV